MDYVLFIIFSYFEFAAIALLGITLFKIQINRKNVIKVIQICLVLSLLSLTLKLVGLNIISIPIQIIAYIFLMSKLLKKRPYLAIFSGFSSYLLYGAIQSGILLLLSYYKLIEVSEIKPFSHKGFIVQFSCFIIFLFVCWFIKRNKEGYDFSPDSKVLNKRIKVYTNKLLLIVICSSLILVVLTTIGFTLYGVYLLWLFALTTVSTFIFLYISLRRDREETFGSSMS